MRLRRVGFRDCDDFRPGRRREFGDWECKTKNWRRAATTAAAVAAADDEAEGDAGDGGDDGNDEETAAVAAGNRGSLGVAVPGSRLTPDATDSTGHGPLRDPFDCTFDSVSILI